MDKEPVIVGKIINTHSNKGAVKVQPITDFPERFFSMSEILLDAGDQLQTLHITAARWHKNCILLTFQEIADMNAAELLKGKYLKIKQKELIELPTDSYYIFQIIGLQVYDADNNYLGQVTEVMETGSNDVYVVQPEIKEKPPLLLPALKKVVKQIDLTEKKMTVQIPEGLLDL